MGRATVSPYGGLCATCVTTVGAWQGAMHRAGPGEGKGACLAAKGRFARVANDIS